MVGANDDVRARASLLVVRIFMCLLAFFFFVVALLSFLFSRFFLESVCLAFLSLSTSCLVSCAITVAVTVPSALSTFACNIIFFWSIF